MQASNDSSTQWQAWAERRQSHQEASTSAAAIPAPESHGRPYASSTAQHGVSSFGQLSQKSQQLMSQLMPLEFKSGMKHHSHKAVNKNNPLTHEDRVSVNLLDEFDLFRLSD